MRLPAHLTSEIPPGLMRGEASTILLEFTIGGCYSLLPHLISRSIKRLQYGCFHTCTRYSNRAGPYVAGYEKKVEWKGLRGVRSLGSGRNPKQNPRSQATPQSHISQKEGFYFRTSLFSASSDEGVEVAKQDRLWHWRDQNNITSFPGILDLGVWQRGPPQSLCATIFLSYGVYFILQQWIGIALHCTAFALPPLPFGGGAGGVGS